MKKKELLQMNLIKDENIKKKIRGLLLVGIATMTLMMCGCDSVNKKETVSAENKMKDEIVTELDEETDTAMETKTSENSETDVLKDEEKTKKEVETEKEDSSKETTNKDGVEEKKKTDENTTNKTKIVKKTDSKSKSEKTTEKENKPSGNSSNGTKENSEQVVKPTEASKPTETPVKKPSATPKPTQKPAETVKPDTGKDSGSSQKPSTTPKPTQKPVATPEPKPTEKPTPSPKPTEKPVHNHTWVDVTETIEHPALMSKETRVVKEAWTETVPVYEDVYRNICNVCKDSNGCGVDITGNEYAHDDNHLLNGEKGGWHGEWRTEQVRTKTVEHPAVTEEVTVVVKEAWTEVKVVGQKCSGCGVTK